MAGQINPEDKHWFVLNFVRPTINARPQAFIDAFNNGDDRLELFAPIVRVAENIGGKVVFKDKMLTYYYVFVRGTIADVKELCAIPGNGFSLMIDRSSERRYGIVPDYAMDCFRRIAQTYSNTVPFYDIDSIELEEGDYVEIVDGAYAGLRGTYVPRSRSTKGKLIIAATASLGAVLWDVDAKYVRILRFANDTRRRYDILDSFIPKLYPIMRKYHDGESLTTKNKSLLTVFNRRMGIVSIDNHKLEAKLLATLMCVQRILGDWQSYEESARRYEKRKNVVTNVWTRALAGLMLSVSKNDMTSLAEYYKNIESTPEKLTEARKQLLTEYQYYLA